MVVALWELIAQHFDKSGRPDRASTCVLEDAKDLVSIATEELAGMAKQKQHVSGVPMRHRDDLVVSVVWQRRLTLTRAATSAR